MSDLRKAAMAATEALEECLYLGDHPCRLRVSAAMTALRAALAQPEAEPVARVAEVHMSRYTIEWTNGPLPEGTLLYATPSTLAQPEATTERDALRTIMRMADRAKEPCGDDPESPAAIRNGKFSSIAIVAAQGLGMVRGPSLAQPDQPTADGPELPPEATPDAYRKYSAQQMLAFRAAGVAQERERCAKVCDDLAANDKLSNYYAVAARAIRKG